MTKPLNRRGFLKGTLASAALLVAGAHLAHAQKAGQAKPTDND